MQILVASAGLGNTMFQYAMTIVLRNHFKGHCAFFISKSNFEHNGYELERVFANIRPYDGLNWLQRMYIHLLEVLHNINVMPGKFFPHKVLFFPRKKCATKESVLYYPNVFDEKNRNAYFLGQFQSYRYYEGYEQVLRQAFTFRENLLNDSTRYVAERIKKSSESVFIHVRRGDYQRPEYINSLGKICSLDYFRKAIDIMNQRLKSPEFFIFSDDTDFIKENFSDSNMLIVDINCGNDSWQDMYLMSLCRNGIISNSTFSWWGAFLIDNKDKIVIAPGRWWNFIEHDEVISPEWIRL